MQESSDIPAEFARVKVWSRIRVFDTLRGLSVVSMVLFHFCYDLVELSGIDLPFFRPPFEDVWRASISWVFLTLAGIMCSYSRNNFARALKYGIVAFAIWLATTVAAIDIPISFGIIFCMAASTLVYALAQKAGIAPRGVWVAFALVVLFLICLKIPSGYLQVAGIKIVLPKALYSSEWLSWLGFPGPRFSSGDYYPLLPYCLLYMAGAAIGPWLKSKLPEAIKGAGLGPLEFIGRHALEIYILHQPVLLLLSELL